MASKNSIIIEIKQTGDGLKIIANESKKAGKQVDDLGKKTDNLGKSTDGYHKKQKGVAQAGMNSTKSFSKMQEQIGSGSSGLVGAYATLAANVFAATALFNALKRAAQVDVLIESLDRLGQASGNNLRVLADSVRDAAGGAIDLAQAMQTASVGSSAGFQNDQIAGLAKVAKQAALALGRDVGDAIDRVTRGAAKLEPEILDELGIFVRVDDAAAAYGATLGKTASELTRFEKRMGFTNAIIEQGNQKFGELGDIDVSSFDRLGATFLDLGRTITDAFNTILGPIAEFFAKNQIALLGFLMAITKGVMQQALPALSALGAKAKQIALDSITAAGLEQTRLAKQNAGYRMQIQNLSFIAAGTNDLLTKVRQGTATTAEREMAERKLHEYIIGAQKRIAAGHVKNIALVENRIEQAQRELALTKKVGATDEGGQMQHATKRMGQSEVVFAKRGENIFGELDKPGGGGIAGYKKALKDANKASSNYRKQQTFNINKNKAFKGSFLGYKKTLAIASMSMKSFGLTSKIAIKGIFTAIPVIGQLLFVLDLLIAGVKKVISLFMGWSRSQTELQKATSATNKLIASYSDTQNAASNASQTASKQLVTAANATQSMIAASNTQRKAQEKATKEMSFFGKITQFVVQKVQKQLMRLGQFFTNIFRGFREDFIRFKISIKEFQKNFMESMNRIITARNKVRETFSLEPIPLMDVDSMDTDISAAKRALKEIDLERISVLSSETFKILPDNVAISQELKVFREVLSSAGEAGQEMRQSLGEDFDINKFLQEMSKGTINLKQFNEVTQKRIKDSKLLDDGLLENGEMQQFLNIVTSATTDTVTRQGNAIENLGETFKNANEKLANFFLTFQKKGAISEFSTIIKQVAADMATLGESSVGAGGEATIAQFDKADASFKQFILNFDDVEAKQKAYNEEVKKLTKEFGKELTAAQRQAIADQTGYGQALNKSVQSAKRLTDEILRGQLFSATQIKQEGRRTKAVQKYVKLNRGAEMLRINSSNKALKIQEKLQKDELTFQRQTNKHIIDKQARIADGNKENETLTDAELGKLATMLVKEEELATTREKQIGITEKSALIGMKALDIQKAQLAQTKLQNSALAAQLKAEQTLLSAQRGEGLRTTAAEDLKAAKKAGDLKLAYLKDELEMMQLKIKYEKIITEARLIQAGYTSAEAKVATSDMQKVANFAQATASSKIKQVEAENKLLGISKTSLLNLTLQSAALKEASDLTKERFMNEVKDKDGKPTGKLEPGKDLFSSENLATTLAGMDDHLAPMREALKELGPEGELIAMAQTGILSLGVAFQQIGEAAKSGDLVAGAEAASQALGVISQLQKANTKAQVAEIDKQIKAEQQRDGKSKESVAKIAGLEKKKEQMQRKAFEQQKKMQIAQAIMSTATGAARSMELGGIIGPILAAMTIAMGLAQVSIIKKQQFQGSGSSDIPKPSTINVGKRDNKVDVSKGATSGETAFLRGQKGIGSNANSFVPGGAAGMKKGYASGGEILVGERGPETITPLTPMQVTPNDKMGGGMSNVNFTINAVDAAGVEQLLVAQKGNIIGMIREAANEHGEEFMEGVNTNAYGGESI